jgi:hypothetical protein
MNNFDAAFAHLRQLCDALDMERVKVTVRRDGRVHFELINSRGFAVYGVDADLVPGGPTSTPNASLRAAFEQWSGT